MVDVRDPVAAGYYARKQIQSRDQLIAWSHRRRFRTGLAIARPLAGARVLDYGCGDGTFLSLLDASATPPALGVGAEIDPRVIADCRRRFAAQPRLRFVDVADLADDGATYDAVFCMEVLEHIPEPQPMLADLERLLRPGGLLAISVPIEIGVPVLVKQAVRRVAGWRGIGDYPGTSGYTARELIRSVLAGPAPHLVRPVFQIGSGPRFHDHKGFNWRVLLGLVARQFDLVRTVTSPFNWAGPQFGTQVWFVARKRAAARRA